MSTEPIQVFKQRVSRKLRGKKRAAKSQLRLAFPEDAGNKRRFGQRRYYGFNVYSRYKLREKLDYMHANPVKRNLVVHPKDWQWSSWSYYETGEKGLIAIDFAGEERKERADSTGNRESQPPHP